MRSPSAALPRPAREDSGTICLKTISSPPHTSPRCLCEQPGAVSSPSGVCIPTLECAQPREERRGHRHCCPCQEATQTGHRCHSTVRYSPEVWVRWASCSPNDGSSGPKSATGEWQPPSCQLPVRALSTVIALASPPRSTKAPQGLLQPGELQLRLAPQWLTTGHPPHCPCYTLKGRSQTKGVGRREESYYQLRGGKRQPGTDPGSPATTPTTLMVTQRHHPSH